jgi:hypothetical protein
MIQAGIVIFRSENCLDSERHLTVRIYTKVGDYKG